MSNTKTVYEALKNAGCKIDSHESDLYVEDTQAARNIIAEFDLKMIEFRSQVNQAMWLELPFMYQPFWDQKSTIHR